MEYDGKAQPVPNAAEDITEVRWVKTGVLDEILANTYPSITEVIQSSLES
jgi:hypothetical protein